MLFVYMIVHFFRLNFALFLIQCLLFPCLVFGLLTQFISIIAFNHVVLFNQLVFLNLCSDHLCLFKSYVLSGEITL